MESDPDFDIDPAIAAAMGFGGFGSQTKGKRKFSTADFVDPNISKPDASHATGANNMPTRERKATKVAEDGTAGSASGEQLANNAQGNEHAPAVHYDPKTQDSPSLELLRHGVKNQQGDMVYFLPSFLEDPWAGLKLQ